MAASYRHRCQLMGGKFVTYLGWLQTEGYLYIERLVTSTSRKEWRQSVSSYTTTNVWEERCLQAKACATFALMNNRRQDTVTIEELQNTSIGWKGWAHMQATIPAHIKKMKGASDDKDGTHKPPAKKGAKTASNAAESEARNLVANTETTMTRYSTIQDAYTTDAEMRKWSSSYMDELTPLVESLKREMDDPFFKMFKLAVIDPSKMRMLKKDQGAGLVGKLQGMVESFNAPMQSVESVLNRVESMMGAANEDGSPSGKRPAPKAKKAAKKAKAAPST